VNKLLSRAWCLVAERLLAQRKMTIAGKEFIILSAATCQCPSAALGVTTDADQTDQRCIAVRQVPAHLVEAVTCLLESERKGGGVIECMCRYKSTGTMFVTFADQQGQF